MKQGLANLLKAYNFLKDAQHLSTRDKLKHFERYTSLNERSRKYVLQASLNFHPSEKLCNDDLLEIAEFYMQNIGFSGQPWLVYNHFDAGHPHIHILSINVKSDGRTISFSNLAKYQSEFARKEIELRYGLIQSEGRKFQEKSVCQNTGTERIRYGKNATMNSISDVLSVTVTRYLYTSLAELNAVLRTYNLFANAGREGSRLKSFGGLQYVALDRNGRTVSMPIKASAFALKPTLPFLKKKFYVNQDLREPFSRHLKTKIDWNLHAGPDLPDFVRRMEKEGISVVFTQHKKGRIEAIFFVDHGSKSVFEGGTLGTHFSAHAILQRCRGELAEKLKPLNPLLSEGTDPRQTGAGNEAGEELRGRSISDENFPVPRLLEDLFRPEDTAGDIPYGLRKKKRRRKKFIQAPGY